MHKSLATLSALSMGLMVAVAMAGCESTHQAGVKSDLRTQWTTVNADTQRTTDAARGVFEGEGLKDIHANATKVDGTVSGKKADGTNVKATINKQSDGVSQVTVNVGTMGDPSLGASLAKQIKQRAEGQQ
jgi:hypothetical protein